MQISIVYIFFGVFMLLLALGALYMLSLKTKIEKMDGTFIEPALGHAGSCIDCENQFVSKEKWRGQPSKCFSCERDMLRRHGEEAVFMATKQKCFDC